MSLVLTSNAYLDSNNNYINLNGGQATFLVSPADSFYQSYNILNNSNHNLLYVDNLGSNSTYFTFSPSSTACYINSNLIALSNYGPSSNYLIQVRKQLFGYELYFNNSNVFNISLSNYLRFDGGMTQYSGSAYIDNHAYIPVQTHLDPEQFNNYVNFSSQVSMNQVSISNLNCSSYQSTLPYSFCNLNVNYLISSNNNLLSINPCLPTNFLQVLDPLTNIQYMSSNLPQKVNFTGSTWGYSFSNNYVDNGSFLMNPASGFTLIVKCQFNQINNSSNQLFYRATTNTSSNLVDSLSLYTYSNSQGNYINFDNYEANLFSSRISSLGWNSNIPYAIAVKYNPANSNCSLWVNAVNVANQYFNFTSSNKNFTNSYIGQGFNGIIYGETLYNYPIDDSNIILYQNMLLDEGTLTPYRIPGSFRQISVDFQPQNTIFRSGIINYNTTTLWSNQLNYQTFSNLGSASIGSNFVVLGQQSNLGNLAVLGSQSNFNNLWISSNLLVQGNVNASSYKLPVNNSNFIGLLSQLSNDTNFQSGTSISSNYISSNTFFLYSNYLSSNLSSNLNNYLTTSNFTLYSNNIQSQLGTYLPNNLFYGYSNYVSSTYFPNSQYINYSNYVSGSYLPITYSNFIANNYTSSNVHYLYSNYVNAAYTNSNTFYNFSNYVNSTYKSTVTSNYSNLTVTNLLYAGQIGINTGSPSYNLDVTSNARIYGGVSKLSLMGISGGSNAISGLDIYTYGTGPPGASVYCVDDGLNGGHLVFYTKPGYGQTACNQTAKMIVTDFGNVGINQISPSYTLDVNGGARIGNLIEQNSNGAVYITNQNVSSNFGNNFGFYQGIQGDTVINSAPGYPIEFKLNNAEYMRINSNGLVGINTLNPQYNLDVSSNARLGSKITTTYQINLSGTVGNYTQIFNINDSTLNLTYSIRVTIVQGRAYNAIMKSWVIQQSYTTASTGGWSLVLPEYNSLINNGNDFALHVNTTNNITYVRIVRTAAGANVLTGMSCTVDLITDGGETVNLNYDGTTGSNASTIGTYNFAPISIQPGQVGINCSPQYALDTTGVIRSYGQGSKFISQGTTGGSNAIVGIDMATYSNNSNIPSCSIYNIDDGSFGGHLGFYIKPPGTTPTNPQVLRAFISSSGNVAIGNNNNPQYLLDIAGSLRASNLVLGNSTNTNSLYMLSSFNNNMTTYNSCYLQFGQSASTNNAAEISFTMAGAPSTNSGLNYLQLGCYGNANRMTILANNQVGINNNNPSYMLDVTGTARITQPLIQNTVLQWRYIMTAASSVCTANNSISWGFSQYSPSNLIGVSNNLFVQAGTNAPASSGVTSPLMQFQYSGIYTLNASVRFGNTALENAFWFAPYNSPSYNEPNTSNQNGTRLCYTSFSSYNAAIHYTGYFAAGDTCSICAYSSTSNQLVTGPFNNGVTVTLLSRSA